MIYHDLPLYQRVQDGSVVTWGNPKLGSNISAVPWTPALRSMESRTEKRLMMNMSKGDMHRIDPNYKMHTHTHAQIDGWMDGQYLSKSRIIQVF